MHRQQRQMMGGGLRGDQGEGGTKRMNDHRKALQTLEENAANIDA